MALTFTFFADAGLSQVASNIAALQATDGTSPAVDRVVYLGSTTADVVLQAFSDPGVDPITVSLVDAATGSGVEAAHVSLATTQAGLDSATPGASIDLAAQITSGSGNAAAIWLRIDTPALSAGTYTDLTLSTGECVESAA